MARILFQIDAAIEDWSSNSTFTRPDLDPLVTLSNASTRLWTWKATLMTHSRRRMKVDTYATAESCFVTWPMTADAGGGNQQHNQQHEETFTTTDAVTFPRGSR